MTALPALLLLLAAARTMAAVDPSRLTMSPITLRARPAAAAATAAAAAAATDGSTSTAPPPLVEPERYSGYFKLNRT